MALSLSNDGTLKQVIFESLASASSSVEKEKVGGGRKEDNTSAVGSSE